MSKRVTRDYLYLVPFLGAKTKERIHFKPCKFTFHISIFRKVAFKSVCSTIHPSSRPRIHLSIYQLIDSTIHLFIYLSTQPSIYLSTHISIHLHIYICGSVCTYTHPFTTYASILLPFTCLCCVFLFSIHYQWGTATEL